MKKAILVLMSSVIATQASVATATTSLVVNKGLISDESSAQRIEDMSNEEILAGIQEISGILALMKKDLEQAEINERTREHSVKVVNYSTKTLTGAYLASMLFGAYNSVSAKKGLAAPGSAFGRSLSLAIVLASSVTALVGITVILLTEDQVAEIEAKIKVAEAQLEELKARVVR